MELMPLQEKGIHDVFDGDMEHSYVIQHENETLGYVCFHEAEPKTICVEFILAKKRGSGHGISMVKALFDLGYETIKGTAIYGPHFFWLSIGAVFDDEVDEDAFDGTFFTLSNIDFLKE